MCGHATLAGDFGSGGGWLSGQGGGPIAPIRSCRRMRAMTAEPVVGEATFDAPLDKVWKAITDGNQMRQWYFDGIPDFRPQRGFATSFNVHHESTDYLHQWTV